MIFPTSWQVNINRPVSMDVLEVYVYRYLSQDLMEFRRGDNTYVKQDPSCYAPAAKPVWFRRLTGQDWHYMKRSAEVPEAVQTLRDEIGVELLDEAIAHHREQARKLEELRG